MSGQRILMVEDDRAVARGLRYGLEAEGFQVAWAESGARALDLARREDPHLILLDIRLPDLSGLDVCRTLRTEGRRVPIIMVTALDEELDKVLGLELGADDYIVKPYSLRELISRVRALLRRSYGELATATPASRLVFGDLEIDLERLQVARADRVLDLTPTEFRLLRFMAGRADRPFTRDALIEAVWGYEEVIGSERTVDVHIRHLREKIEADPANPRHIVTVRGVGYKFQP
jgi:DNA-binding response OmpR family regulator